MATAKNYNIGELRTPVIIEEAETTVNENNREVTVWRPLFGGKPVFCKWLPVTFKDDYNARIIDRDRVFLYESALLVMRYSPLVTRTCRIKRLDEEVPYTVVSVENVRERGLWLEVRVYREVNRR
ncbi:MAG TPA: hypothetical protein GXX22_02805 [Clostridiales bacterium]|jgi:hypothetical protein|nr:hypothetical protein [Clostridiales bacterium]